MGAIKMKSTICSCMLNQIFFPKSVTIDLCKEAKFYFGQATNISIIRNAKCKGCKNFFIGLNLICGTSLCG